METLQVKTLREIPAYLHGQFVQVVRRRKDRTGARFVTVRANGVEIEFLEYHLKSPGVA